MASLAHSGHHGSPSGSAALARRLDADAAGLATFRLLADVEYERSLSQLIENEIIPRLMIAHSLDAPVPNSPAPRLSTADAVPMPLDLPLTIGRSAPAEIEPAEIQLLSDLCLRVEADELLSYIEAVLGRGLTADTVMVDLLAPTARRLGELWEDDLCDFVDVTMGLWRLQEVVHEIASRAPAERVLAAGGHRALFASMPGDQHHFGTLVVDEVFRRGGWVTTRLEGAATPDLVKSASDQWFDLIGLTVSCECHIENLHSVIVAMRNVSKNPRVCIMVGGRVFVESPERSLEVGADGTARDAKLALELASDLVRIREEQILIDS